MKIIDTYYLGDVLVVLTQGDVGTITGIGDYAAYIGLSAKGEQGVAIYGTKISSRLTTAFFPWVSADECRL